MTKNTEELLELISEFENFIHDNFHFRKMLTKVDPKVIVDMFFNELIAEGYYINAEDLTFYKNEIVRCYDYILGNWTNYLMSDLSVQVEVKRALEIYGLKCCQSSYAEVIDLGMQYLRDHRVDCVDYQDFEELKEGHHMTISDLEAIDADKRYIYHIMMSLLSKTLDSFDEYISLKALMIENNQNLNEDKLLLIKEYQKRNLQVPFESPKPKLNNKSRVRTRN